MESTDEYRTIRLIEAAMEGRVEEVRALLAQQAAVNRKGLVAVDGSEGYRTPLTGAVEAGHLEVVELLLSAGADPELELWGNSPLSFAARKGHLEVLGRLLAAGAKPSDSDPLTYACLADDLAAVRLLLSSGAKADQRDRRGNGCTPLIAAARCGHVCVVDLLLASGTGPDATQRDGGTALMEAAQFGQIGAVRLLLDRGADVGARAKDGRTALAAAALAAANRTEIQALLLERGAEIDEGVFLAACAGGDVALVRTGLARGLSADTANPDGITLLMAAASSDHGEIVGVLLAAGAAVNARTVRKAEFTASRGYLILERNSTALIVAAQYDSREAVRLLLAAGAEVDAKLPNRKTALMVAAWVGHFEPVRMLVAHGADLDAATTDGETARVLASYGERDSYPDDATADGRAARWMEANRAFSDIVDFLLSTAAATGAKDAAKALLEPKTWNNPDRIRLLLTGQVDVRGKRRDGWTALMLAAWSGHADLAEALVAKGAQVGAKSKDGRTALTIALETGHNDVAALLQSHAA